LIPAIGCGSVAKVRPAATADRRDLYVEVHVREHAIFERDGAHLSCEVPVSFVTAALGGSIEVPTLKGQVMLKIPAETQSGRVFRLKDKGVRQARGGEQGDLFCRIVVETPVKLSSEQRELLQRLMNCCTRTDSATRRARSPSSRGQEFLQRCRGVIRTVIVGASGRMAAASSACSRNSNP